MPKVDLDYTEREKYLEDWAAEAESFQTPIELSEADTRSKIIDPLFKDVLGWDESQIKREAYTPKIGFYDYKFDSGINKFVLEAKKTTIEFSMPKNRTIKYKSLNIKSDLRKAIEQGINYATTIGISVVVAYNGKQLAVTYIPYTHIQNFNDTYLFRDINDICTNFSKFFNILSPIVNSNEELHKLIVPDQNNPLIRPRPPFKDRITSIQKDINAKSPSNELSQYFESIQSRYFSDIITDEELLMKCYCGNTSAAKLGREIETVLRDRAPLLNFPVEIQELEVEKKSAGKFEKRFLKAKNDTKLFLILGGSGVGKTTFIYRFFNFILEELDRDFLVWLYLDFKKYSEEGSNIDDFVYRQIEEQLLDKYSDLNLFTDIDILKSVFSKDLKYNQALLNLLPTQEERDREIVRIITEKMKDKEYFVKRVFEYLRSKEYGTCIVYDNVDQLNIGLQTRLFKHANSLRESLRTTMICSLREEVYYSHRRDKAINFAEIELFHIPAPKFLNVLSKRLKLLREETKSDEVFRIESEAGIMTSINKQDIIDVITKTFLGKQENLLLIEMLGNRDIRESLKIFKKMLTSHNINIDDLLVSAATLATTGKEISLTIENSELLRGLALQDRIHFVSSKTEPLVNIYDIADDGFFSHFIKARILLYAQSRLGQALGKLPNGYFLIKDMYNEKFHNFVTSYGRFLDICKSLQIAGALVNANGTINEIEEDNAIILGAAGSYYLSHLIGNPFYLSLMSIDTQISNEEIHNKILKLYESSLNDSDVMKKRRYIAMARKFIEYLKEEENKERLYFSSVEIDTDSSYYFISNTIEDKFNKYCQDQGLNL
ncbi:hypothetical protein [Cytobacillus gottheilii]|uniref:Uncharacterized protein n=1 Tax=Cytobacillus gottheilii TaxID=859144 RepID=A0ABX8F909_9BACI|nr:hypothetical protein [Cytobacillus gottheilii]QVY60913.1 hypothetical protein J1899_18360 [Cytobacillus gottheilii]